MFIVVLSFVISCDRLTDTTDQSGSLKYITTELGGCNGQDDNRKNSINELENDTIYYWLSEDTLNFLTGINYICCAPFATDYIIDQDTVTMKLLDTCPDPYESCYCKCMCYYSFWFQFNSYNGKKLLYKVLLYDPSEENPEILFTGEVGKK
jgi:hypothetical protein